MNAFQHSLRFLNQQKLPVILQNEMAECGLACLAMISAFYGYETDLNSLRRKFSLSLYGTRLNLGPSN
jgi:ATP-binding cassette, subfamily B, bacterial CvaB/MchF/RaxB